MMIITLTAALLIGCLAGLGIGGGGLLVIYLTMVLKKNQLTAQGINLIFFIFCALASLFIHLRKRKLNIRNIAIISICGILASLVGSHISHNTDPALLRKIFGALLIFSGVSSLFKKSGNTFYPKPYDNNRAPHKERRNSGG